MAETLGDQLTAEQRVFGDAFTIDGGEADDIDTRRAYFADRAARLAAGETVWQARVLDSTTAVNADLFQNGKIVAEIFHEYDRDPGKKAIAFGILKDEAGEKRHLDLTGYVPFEDAVTASEQYAANL